MAKNIVSVEPWGGKGGDERRYLPSGKISVISITYDDIFRTISFTSTNNNGGVEKSPQFGEGDGPQKTEINIDVETDKLKGISGTFDEAEGERIITSLSFTTLKNKVEGPFGSAKGTKFSLVLDEHDITGFYCRSGWWLDAIGVLVDTTKTARFAYFGSLGVKHANEWDYQPNQPISRITITYEDAIRAIMFTNKDGTNSSIFGNRNGKGQKAEINIDVDNEEKLKGISGTFGHSEGYDTITSLSFTTDKNKVHGPFGKAIGDTFSLLLNHGFFTGFYGRGGGLIHAIGVYVTNPNPLPPLTSLGITIIPGPLDE